MNLGELRSSISKLPPDMNNMHVVFITLDKFGKKDYHLLAATGIIDEDNVNAVALLSDEVCHELIRTKTLKMKEELKDIEIDE